MRRVRVSSRGLVSVAGPVSGTGFVGVMATGYLQQWDQGKLAGGDEACKVKNKMERAIALGIDISV